MIIINGKTWLNVLVWISKTYKDCVYNVLWNNISEFGST